MQKHTSDHQAAGDAEHASLASEQAERPVVGAVSTEQERLSIRVASDLHLEFFRGQPIDKLAAHFLPADRRDAGSVLVLAGDISSEIAQLREFLLLMAQRFAFIIYIPGNHEYYRSDYELWNRAAEEALDGIPRVQAIIGRVSSRQFAGVRFVCGTLWGDGGDTPKEADAIGQYLNDFRLIGIFGKSFAVPDMAILHREQHRTIERLIGGMRTVVVTHHLPSYALSHPRFGNVCTGGFAGKCDALMQGPDAPQLWIHGHTHDTSDRQMHDTRVVCNPAGYYGEWGTQFNQFFAAPKFVEVGPALAKGADCGMGTDDGCEAAKPSASNEPNEKGNAA